MAWADAKQIVMGHTLVNDIQLLFGGRVIGIDLMHETNALEGISRALWIENDITYVINQEGKKERLGDFDGRVVEGQK